jgi:hypothetical protein
MRRTIDKDLPRRTNDDDEPMAMNLALDSQRWWQQAADDQITDSNPPPVSCSMGADSWTTTVGQGKSVTTYLVIEILKRLPGLASGSVMPTFPQVGDAAS